MADAARRVSCTAQKRIDSLISREYMERDRGNSSVYNYLA